MQKKEEVEKQKKEGKKCRNCGKVENVE